MSVLDVRLSEWVEVSEGQSEEIVQRGAQRIRNGYNGNPEVLLTELNPSMIRTPKQAREQRTVKAPKPFVVKNGKLVEVENETAITGGRKFNGARKSTGV